MVTDNDVGDCEVLPELLDQIEGDLNSVAADGAYDTREDYEAIRKKKDSGYHRRSLAETAMFRVKQLMDATLSSRRFESQCVELMIRCAVINRMTALGMPESELVL